MTTLWIVFAAMVVVALGFLAPPLLGRWGPKTTIDRKRLNLAIHRERMDELKRLQAAGELGAEQFATAVEEVERDLAGDLIDDGIDPAGGSRGRWGALLAVLFVPLLSVSLYAYLGSSDRLEQIQASAQGAASSGENRVGSVDEMMTALAAKLEQNPDQPEGWFLLGRSYLTLERYPEAARALREAHDRDRQHSEYATMLAQALSLARGGAMAGEPAQLVEAVLKRDPNHLQARFLAGIAALQQSDFSGAVEHWRMVLALNPSPEDQRLVEGYIERARELAAQQGQELVAVPAPIAAPEASASAASLSVRVDLAPEFAAEVTPETTLFVFAVAVDGPRMPLAIRKLTVAELPATVELDDSMAMMPQMKLSAFPEVSVGARVSFGGDAMPRSGDLEGRIGPVPVADATAPVQVVIDRRIP